MIKLSIDDNEIQAVKIPSKNTIAMKVGYSGIEYDAEVYAYQIEDLDIITCFAVIPGIDWFRFNLQVGSEMADHVIKKLRRIDNDAC